MDGRVLGPPPSPAGQRRLFLEARFSGRSVRDCSGILCERIRKTEAETENGIRKQDTEAGKSLASKDTAESPTQSGTHKKG